MTDAALVPVPDVAPRVELGVVRADRPAELLAAATAAADALAGLIESRTLYSNIQGKRFVKCEGWTTLAAMLGCTPHEVSVTEVEGVFTATVELRRLADGQPVGRASAECGAPDELDRWGKPMWANRPRYARRSMALTRATAKACRLSFSWVMVLAGFEATPSEEVPDPAPKRAPAPKQDNSAKGLSEKPAALVDNDDEPLPFEAHTDLNPDTGEVHEYGELVDDAETLRVFRLLRRAGVTKDKFLGWYVKVRGRAYKGLRVEDVDGLLAAAKENT